jgi:hypothetical protein
MNSLEEWLRNFVTSFLALTGLSDTELSNCLHVEHMGTAEHE